MRTTLRRRALFLGWAWWFFLTALCSRAQSNASFDGLKPLALVRGSIVISPSAAPIVDGVVVLRGGKILAVGPHSVVVIPPDAETLDCRGKTIVAGFWNCHVHFTEPKWQGAAQLPRSQLEDNLREMLTSYGFTSVVDLGSLAENTVALRKRIQTEDVMGPRILTAGMPFYPQNGVPYYVTESLPPEAVSRLYAPTSTEEAVREVDENIAAGADLIKLFLVTGVRENGGLALRKMDAAIAAAVVAEAHRLGKQVAVHPSRVSGVEMALESRADILAHTIEDSANWTPQLVSRLTKAHVALIPTLALFKQSAPALGFLRQVKDYADAGGQLLFGTDEGFITDYHQVTQEFLLLSEAGLSFAQILKMLTTAPAARFGFSESVGTIVKGAEADVVVLNGNIADGARILTQVHATVRGGRVIYLEPR